MIVLRSALYALWFYGALILVGLMSLPGALMSQRGAQKAGHDLARAYIGGLRAICGAKIEFRGVENLPKSGALVAAKHQSALDTFAPFLAIDNPAFVFKAELSSAPIFGWYLKRGGHIMVNREANAQALRSMLKEARAAIAQGRSVVIFPEGTRTPPGAAPDYKVGVAALYRDLNVPCVPVALDTARVWPNSFIRKPGTTIVEFLPAIPPGLSREDFMRTLEERIETRTNALMAETNR
jgi:1-acyl-sn-glycerol-3-phosphate acyltransferase